MQDFEIKTDRLGLRLLQMDDLNLLAVLHADPDVRKYFHSGTFSREQTKSRIEKLISFYKEKGLPTFVMFNLKTEEFIGRCGFAPLATGEIEVGYQIHKKYWNQGYASEALKAVLEWAKKNIHAEYIIALTRLDHIASQRVMQKCGMEYYKDDLDQGDLCVFYRIKNQ